MVRIVVIIAAALATGTNAQTIQSVDSNIVVSTVNGGDFFVNDLQVGATINTNGQMLTALSSGQSQQSTAITGMGTIQTQVGANIQSISGCGANGKVWTGTACTDPVPAPNNNVQRINGLASDLSNLEATLSTLGVLSCSICPAGQYADTPCTQTQATSCSNCPAGTYSLGGLGGIEQCVSCATGVPNCHVATCDATTGNNKQCTSCSVNITNNQGYKAQGGVCVACGPYEYLSNANTCTTCPKEPTCGSATCQANTGMSLLPTGVPDMSSVYTPGVRTYGRLGFLNKYNDGTLGYGVLGPHSGTTTAQLRYPWFSVDMTTLTQGGAPSTPTINKVVFYNREEGCGCRSLRGTTSCAACDPSLTYSGADQGFIIGVSTTALSTSLSAPPSTTNCTAGMTNANCICQWVRRYKESGDGKGPYEIDCKGVTSKYVYILLPGNTRMLNFGEMQIWGSYPQYQPGPHSCVVPCTATGCEPGRATCTLQQASVGTCPQGGCAVAVTGGQAYVYQNGQCQACSGNTYRVNNSGVTSCQQCPCGRPCQPQVWPIQWSNVIQGPGQWGSFAATNALDGNPNTFTHTQLGNNPIWQGDMGGVFTITSVLIGNRRGNCGSRLVYGRSTGCPGGNIWTTTYTEAQGNTAKIGVSNTPCVANQQTCQNVNWCGSITRLSRTYTHNVTCANGGVTGRYLIVQLPGTRRYLQLARVEPVAKPNTCP